MAESIKKFFGKKKLDAKFKKAGSGHKLNEQRLSGTPAPKKNAYVPPVRSGLTDESKAAAAAALARLEKKKDSTAFNTSMAAIKAQVKKEVEAEKIASTSASHKDEKKKTDSVARPEDMAVSGVFFRCPAIGDEVLPKNEWEHRIRSYLQEQAETDPGLSAVLMLHSLNYNREKVQQCVETLSKYFDNILKNPTEEKYRKIRRSNKVFLEKVAPLEGATMIIENAGFVLEDEFYVYREDALTEEGMQNLEMILDALTSAEPITLELDRNLMVLLPSHVSARRDLPRDFFHLSPEEVKRTQQARIDAIEKSSMLMTKAMRQKEEMRELMNYRYCLIRVRFPDGIYLQGTFGAYEPFKAVTEFLQENLTDPEDFTLIGPTGEKIDKAEEKTLMDLRLVPSSVLKLQSEGDNHLLPEVLILVQQLPVS